MRKLRSLTTRECAVRGAAVPPQAPQRVVCCRAGMEPRLLLLAAPVATAACRVLPRRFGRPFGWTHRRPLAPPCGVYCVCVGAVWWDFSPRSPTCVYEVNNPFILH